ncbi:cysteine-rich receptor-like protein kinase [Tanacetum coccineum]|uniref:Cysteine-rich receptor-like protein kinase n=1 Tax=Tanacetum coccineum TaxID=301880 RepID=A0ABQ5IVQ8_9ASTR
MLTGKWTPMNASIQKFNQLVAEMLALSGENDEDWITMVEILYKPPGELKGIMFFRVTDEKHEHFGDDALPRPPGLQRIAKSQRSGSNSTAGFGSNPLMYQEFMKEQYELDRKAKNGGDRARERRAKDVNPFSKDCGGHESATNRHPQDGSGRRRYHQRPNGTNPSGISTNKLVGASRKMHGLKESHNAAKVYLVDGKPIKSILKKSKVFRMADMNTEESPSRKVSMSPVVSVREFVIDTADIHDIGVEAAAPVGNTNEFTTGNYPHGAESCTVDQQNGTTSAYVVRSPPTDTNMHVEDGNGSKTECRSSPQMKLGFASVVTANDVQVTSTNNEGYTLVLENYDTVLPKAAMENVKHKYANTLVGYFIDGRRVSLKRNEVTKVPVWIKLYNVPVVAYSANGLSLIGTQVGKPIMLDAFTSSMCEDPWGRINFARALVEINVDSILKHEVSMAIPMEDGIEYTREVIRVEYEWKPPHCTDCKIFGHSFDKCPKRVPVTTVDVQGDGATGNNSDGFMVVKRKENKGKKADTQSRSRHIDRIRLNKPKPNFYWQKKGTTKRGAEVDTTNQVGANALNKVYPSTSNSFDALNTMDMGDDFGASSSKGNQEAGLKTSQGNEYCESDDEVDEFLFPGKFGDTFDIRLKGRVRK